MLPNPTLHFQHTDPEDFQHILDGKKNYFIDIEKKDGARYHPFNINDIVVLKETVYSARQMQDHHSGGYPGFTIEGKPLEYTDREYVCRITHIKKIVTEDELLSIISFKKDY